MIYCNIKESKLVQWTIKKSEYFYGLARYSHDSFHLNNHYYECKLISEHPYHEVRDSILFEDWQRELHDRQYGANEIVKLYQVSHPKKR